MELAHAFVTRPLVTPVPASAVPRSSVRARRAVAAAAVPERRPPGAVASTNNYVVPLDASPSGITRPLVEILRDLNKRVPDTIVRPPSRRASASDPVVPWYLQCFLFITYSRRDLASAGFARDPVGS